MLPHPLSARRIAPLVCALVVLISGFEASAQERLGGRLRFLRHEMDRGKLAGALRESVPVSLRFAQPPSLEELRAAQDAGARFHAAPAWRSTAKARLGAAEPIRAGVAAGPQGDILGGRTVFPVEVAWQDLERLSRLPSIVRIESSWKPRRVPPLFSTRVLSGAEQAWEVLDPDGKPLDGRGVLIADIDTGVDVFHPDYWRADGPVYSWIDVDLSGDYSAGDAVDMNGNSIAEPGETLAWYNSPGGAAGTNANLQLHVDHFYRDENDNGVRDFGPPSFNESDPTYGELLFRPEDSNSNGLLDSGEILVALSSSKVLAVYETDGTVRRVGIDLIANQGDTFGHGTNVGSILVGGEKGRRFCGFAPAASIIFANLSYAGEYPFVTPLDVRMSWAAAEGADIIVYEDGEWIWEFLDGSSNVEILMNQLAEQGIINVAAAGNLATGGMHTKGDLGASVGASMIKTLNVVSPGGNITRAWGDFYFRPELDDEVIVSLKTPAGGSFTLGGDGTTNFIDGYEIFHVSDTSTRGTVRVDFRLSLAIGSPWSNLDGAWEFTITRNAVGSGSGALTIHGMSWDEISGWFGSSTWSDATTLDTITWPGTADSSITVAAYEPTIGDINSFSGRGTRVDGASLIDVTAPGSITYTGMRKESGGGVPGGYGGFGGTSAATPHVAGAAALLLQWDPTLGSGEMRALLRGGAAQDAFTGSVPNDTWGAGKLDVFQSIFNARTDAPAELPGRGRGVELHANVPNPFNPSTEIRYTLERAGLVEVEIFDLKGRRVRVLHRGTQEAGAQSVRWDGRSADGAAVASGIYLVRVVQDGVEAARKLSLLK